MDLDPKALRYFVTVAEQLHFTRAARSLGISRTTLSTAVLDLERALGEPLFVRPSETTELTAAGHALLERATALLTVDDGQPEPEPGPVFRIAIVPGVTVSKWTRVWAERRPEVPVSVVRTSETDQVGVLHRGLADVGFVRLPVDRDGLDVIPLYREVPVVVVDRDHVLSLLEEVSVADLVDEHLLQDADTVPQWRDAAATSRTAEVLPLPPMRDVADAIALVAAGIGVVVVPQSVARLHHRKDVTYRPVTDLDPTEVGLAWPSDRITPEVEEFVGIVRGRSPRSSRSATPAREEQRETPPPRESGTRPSGSGGTRRDAPARTAGRPASAKGRRRGTR